MKSLYHLFCLALLALYFNGIASVQGDESKKDSNGSKPRYEQIQNGSSHGIGKVYMGREISRIMGHQGSDWLERPERNEEENTDLLMRILDIKPGQTVADIGAGSGYITRRLAKMVGEDGTVYAVDVQPEMLKILGDNLANENIENVVTKLGEEKDPRLPDGSLDLIVMVDVYHEFAWPFEMLSQMKKALKPSGRIAFVEYRAEDPDVPILKLHKMSEAQVKTEAKAAGLKWLSTDARLPMQHVVFFTLAH